MKKIRAAGLKKHKVSDKKGSEYRRISVEFVFVDAF